MLVYAFIAQPPFHHHCKYSRGALDLANVAFVALFALFAMNLLSWERLIMVSVRSNIFPFYSLVKVNTHIQTFTGQEILIMERWNVLIRLSYCTCEHCGRCSRGAYATSSALGRKLLHSFNRSSGRLICRWERRSFDIVMGALLQSPRILPV